MKNSLLWLLDIHTTVIYRFVLFINGYIEEPITANIYRMFPGVLVLIQDSHI